MAIKVLPVELSDFATMRKFIDSKDGQLAGVAVDSSMPVTNDEDAARRNEWSLQLQQELFENDDTAHFLKAVDTDDNDAISCLAHWHFFPAGYVPSKLQYAGLKDMDDEAVFPKGMNVPLYKTILGSMINERKNWTGDGPQWILSNIKTRAPMRRRGAAGALVQWGVNKAKADNCPAYLEADPGGVSLYGKFGFVPVGKIPVDLHPFGIPDVYILTKMAANQQIAELA